MGDEFSPAPVPTLVPVPGWMKMLEQATVSSGITSRAGASTGPRQSGYALGPCRGVRVASLGTLARAERPGHPAATGTGVGQGWGPEGDTGLCQQGRLI